MLSRVHTNPLSWQPTPFEISRHLTSLYIMRCRCTSNVKSLSQVTILIAVAKSEPVPVGVLAKILLAERTTLTRNLALLSMEGLVFVSPR
jgi:DNA-binding MarR family transcriptional regulator